MKSMAAAKMSDEEIKKVTWENAARWYQFDPFEHRTREECTVGRTPGRGRGRRHHPPGVRGAGPLPRAGTQCHGVHGRPKLKPPTGGV